MTQNQLTEIFNKLGFKIRSHPVFISYIEMGAEEAFSFSSIVGSSYLIYPYGITMKGRSEIFIHRSIFSNGYLIYSPGLFSRDQNGYLIEGDSKDILLNKYPSIFTGIKKLIIIDITNGNPSNIEESVYNQINENGEDPSEYLLYKNYTTRIVSESLMEYFACVHFIKQGYLVENQVPWFQQNLTYKNKVLQGGIPDFSAFKSSVIGYLKSVNILPDDKGLPINLLPVITSFRSIRAFPGNIQKNVNYELLIGEAKTSNAGLAQAKIQLEKYQAVELANEVFTIIPDVEESGVINIGNFYIENAVCKYNKQTKQNKTNTSSQAIDNSWIDTYIKMLLLGNFNIPTIYKFINKFRETNSLNILEFYDATHLLDSVANTDNSEFFKYFFK